MQYEEKEIRRLAILYWEGKIPLKDESILFEFISNSANKEKYAQWEKDWKLSNEKEPEINRQWELLQNRIRARENISGKTAFKPSIPLWKKMVAAAAIALLVLSTTFSIYEIMYSRRNEIFTVEAPLGEKSKIELPDGSTVWINAGSQIRYTNRFNSLNRTIELTGEAYFDVAKQNNKPFTVKLHNYDIEVKGTQFNVSSYENEEYTTTTLMEGAILIRRDGKEYRMKPGEMVQFDVQNQAFHFSRANTAQYKSWTEDRLEYDAITLEELFNRLSRQYNVQVHVNPEVDLNTTLSVSFKNKETTDEMFYGVSKVASIKYKRKNNDIYISKK